MGSAKTKTKLKLMECRNALLDKVEGLHKVEQEDSDKAKKIKRKNGSYRMIKFNETELKMLEEVVELKNDPNNKALQAQMSKKNLKKKGCPKKAFISRANEEQNHKQYKEFVQQKQEEFNKKTIVNKLPPISSISPKKEENIETNDVVKEIVNDVLPA